MEIFNKSGSIMGIIGFLVFVYLLGTKGGPIAQAAEGFATAGGSLISVLQGNAQRAA